MIYYHVDNHRLKHAMRSPGGSWQFDVVEQAMNFEDYAATSMAIDSAGGLHVSYQQRFITGGEDLRYASRSPTAGCAWRPAASTRRRQLLITCAFVVITLG